MIFLPAVAAIDLLNAQNQFIRFSQFDFQYPISFIRPLGKLFEIPMNSMKKTSCIVKDKELCPFTKVSSSYVSPFFRRKKSEHKKQSGSTLFYGLFRHWGQTEMMMGDGEDIAASM